MVKFPRKEEGNLSEKETERRGTEGKDRKRGRGKKERKKEIKVKGQNWVVYWKRRRNRVKRNEGAWLATRKKNIFLGPGGKVSGLHPFCPLGTPFYCQESPFFP